MDPQAAMEPHAELAKIHARQGERAERAADVFIGGGGGIASLSGAILAAFSVDEGAGTLAFLTVLGGGAALTAALYAVVSGLRANAEAAAARHAALAGDLNPIDEADDLTSTSR
jgi:hypothetical protein